jgi:hypothetical protein
MISRHLDDRSIGQMQTLTPQRVKQIEHCTNARVIATEDGVNEDLDIAIISSHCTQMQE